MCYMKGGVIKGGRAKIELIKKLILVILPLSIFFCLELASYGTVSNGKGVSVYNIIAIK